MRRRAAFYALGDESGVLLGQDGVELVVRWLRSLTANGAEGKAAAAAAAGAATTTAAAEAAHEALKVGGEL